MRTPKGKADSFSFDWLPDVFDARSDMRLTFEQQVVGKWSVSELSKALTHENVEVRQTAIWFLGMLGDKRAERALLWVFANEPDIDNRGSAADWLGQLGSKRAVTALLDALQNDPHVKVRERAASGLRVTWRDKRVVDVLVAVMANKAEDPYVREMVAEALDGHDAKKAAPVLTESLLDTSVNVRYWSATSLADMKCAEALPELSRLASTDTAICYDPDGTSWVYGSVSGAAAKALIRIKEDLEIPLTEEEAEYSQFLKERAEKYWANIEDANPGEEVTFWLGDTYVEKTNQDQS